MSTFYNMVTVRQAKAVAKKHHLAKAEHSFGRKDKLKCFEKSKLTCEIAPKSGWTMGGPSRGTGVDVLHPAGAHPMIYLSTRLYWNKKIKIAILALATFAAMC